MTNLEAVKILSNGVLNGKDDTPESNEAIELAISALENIDRIKAERDAAEVCYACAINTGSRWEWRGV